MACARISDCDCFPSNDLCFTFTLLLLLLPLLPFTLFCARVLPASSVLLLCVCVSGSCVRIALCLACVACAARAQERSKERPARDASPSSRSDCQISFSIACARTTCVVCVCVYARVRQTHSERVSTCEHTTHRHGHKSRKLAHRSLDSLCRLFCSLFPCSSSSSSKSQERQREPPALIAAAPAQQRHQQRRFNPCTLAHSLAERASE